MSIAEWKLFLDLVSELQNQNERVMLIQSAIQSDGPIPDELGDYARKIFHPDWKPRTPCV